MAHKTMRSWLSAGTALGLLLGTTVASTAFAGFPGEEWNIDFVQVTGSAAPSLASAINLGLTQANQTYFYGDRNTRMEAAVRAPNMLDLRILDTASGAVLAERKGLVFDGAGDVTGTVTGAALSWMDQLDCGGAGCDVAVIRSRAAPTTQLAAASPPPAPDPTPEAEPVPVPEPAEPEVAVVLDEPEIAAPAALPASDVVLAAPSASVEGTVDATVQADTVLAEVAPPSAANLPNLGLDTSSVPTTQGSSAAPSVDIVLPEPSAPSRGQDLQSQRKIAASTPEVVGLAQQPTVAAVTIEPSQVQAGAGLGNVGTPVPRAPAAQGSTPSPQLAEAVLEPQVAQPSVRTPEQPTLGTSVASVSSGTQAAPTVSPALQVPQPEVQTPVTPTAEIAATAPSATSGGAAPAANTTIALAEPEGSTIVTPQRADISAQSPTSSGIESRVAAVAPVAVAPVVETPVATAPAAQEVTTPAAAPQISTPVATAPVVSAPVATTPPVSAPVAVTPAARPTVEPELAPAPAPTVEVAAAPVPEASDLDGAQVAVANPTPSPSTVREAITTPAPEVAAPAESTIQVPESNAPSTSSETSTTVQTEVASIDPDAVGPSLANAQWVGFTPAVFTGADGRPGAWISGPFDRKERTGWITDTATGATTRVSFVWREAGSGGRAATLSRAAAQALGLGQGDVANLAVYLPR